MDKTTNIIFCGIGGQGVLKAAEVCSWAAIFEGLQVKKSEIRGVAQRSGSVDSHVRFGKQVISPFIPAGRADFLVSFYEEEAGRLRHFLKPKGMEVAAGLKKPVDSACDKRDINIFMLGELSKHLGIRKENWLKAIGTVFPSKLRSRIKEVFIRGRES